MEDWQQGVIDEAKQLEDKTSKLFKFQGTVAFRALLDEDQALLIEQFGHMLQYLYVLRKRLGRITVWLT